VRGWAASGGEARVGGAELFPVLPLPLRAGRTAGCLRLGASTHVMGVLNVTPDSFSDGGQLGHLDDVLARAADMLAAGAAILDIGGQSTRPHAPRVAPEEELARVLPAIQLRAPPRHQPDLLSRCGALLAVGGTPVCCPLACT